MSTPTTSTAGHGDPYWFEWFVGLLEVVSLLDASSDVESVAFQVEGAKGWDDVVVKVRGGTRRCYQVKHTRVAENLTFGDLVQRDDKGMSVLRSLFDAWRVAGLNDGKTTCILYTNRDAGQRWATTDDGIHRPPLLEFTAWLHRSLTTVTTLAEIVPEGELQDAWAEWRSQLAGGTDSEQVAFLRAFEVRVRQDDLDGLSERVRRQLAVAFGVSKQRVGPVFDALHRALKKWTTGHPGVTVEELCSELALPTEAKDLAPAPPPPAPFFPSRMPIADHLVALLQDPQCEPVIFLTAEPGAGKTSVLSWLSNRRPDMPFAGSIGARFFCFEPIRPETPVIAPDASRVRPEDLWRSLLSQFREGLRGRLHELRVPLRNDLLTWSEAREHVLRLASAIGRERSQRFVLVIDGIDHAARAAQAMPQQIADFFASLPSPDELEKTAIRLLIAGQPAAYYADQYPQWLQGQHPKVKQVSLPLLQSDDVAALYDSANSLLPPQQRDEVLRLIMAKAKGNTLATVFAVAEIERAASLEELAGRLDNRHLADGLNVYYHSIWQHMLLAAGDLASGVDACLVGALSLARTALSPSLLAGAFQEWQRPAAWWRTLLESLGPLVIAGDDGFRVRHNDVRVFLTTRFTELLPERRQTVVSQLADHYRSATSDRLTAHVQLFDLLAFAGRSAESARIFSVDWVIEAAAVGIETEQLSKECMMAVRGLPVLKDWTLVGAVVCASATVTRLGNAREYSDRSFVSAERPLPPFLPSEAMVRPLTQWSLNDLHALVSDAFQLVECGERPRALALLGRWLEGLNLRMLVAQLPDAISEDRFPRSMDAAHPPDRLGELGQAVFERLGQLCCLLQRRVPRGKPSSPVETDADFMFERGFIRALTGASESELLPEVVHRFMPRYLANCAEALRGLVRIPRWDLVREMLVALKRCRDRIDSLVLAEATWWALRSDAAKDAPEWLCPLDSLDLSGLKGRGLATPEYDREALSALLNVARSLGWIRPDLHPGDVAEKVYRAWSPADHLAEQKPPTVLVLQTAALIGRLEAAISRGGIGEARALVPAENVRTLLSALWGDVVMSNVRFQHRTTAADVAGELATICGALGADFDAAALAAAKPIAETFPADFRKNGLWSAIERSGDRELLVAWVRHWLDNDGKVWQLGHDEAAGIVQDFVPLAERVGEVALAQEAVSRLAWMPVGYLGHKEYAFEHILDWFREASSRSPELWRTLGWRLWCLCEICDAQYGDNRLDNAVRTAISSAALRCGASDWWSLVSSTFPDKDGEDWHSRTSDLLIEGAEGAFRAGTQIGNDDCLALWCIAISLTMWFNKNEVASLGALRSTMLHAAATASQREELSAGFLRTPRGKLPEDAFKITEGSEELRRDGSSEEPHEQTAEISIESLLSRIADGGHVLPSEAAKAIRDLHQSGRADQAEVRGRIFGALGADRDYAIEWSHIDRNVAGSVHLLASVASDDELWLAVAALAREYKDSEYWPASVAANLDRLAIERAKIRGLDELLVGLNHHLTMHSRLAFGGGPSRREVWATLPDREAELSWRDVAIRLLSVLLDSHSAEVLEAATEGMHSLVAVDTSVIPQLLQTLTTEWQRHWLLNAAEAWAALYPNAISGIGTDLQRTICEGSLQQRLQAWIILCKVSDVTGAARPRFPLPDTAAAHPVDVPTGTSKLLHVPPMQVGQRILIGRFSGVESTLRLLNACGWDLSDLEASIGERLLAQGEHASDPPPRKGPRRRGDFSCTSLDGESAISAAILSVLSSDECDETGIVRLAQGLLDNEDACIQTAPLRPASHTDLWPPDEIGNRNEMTSDEMKVRLTEIATIHDVPSGWRTFCAQVRFYTWKKDFELRLWWEQLGSDLILRHTRSPSCPSGRSFLWWLGDFCEPELDRFVSGLFVGGRQRLHYDHFEIQPAKAWRDFFGWSPDSRNPLMWTHKGVAVAQYDRLHGPLRDTPHGPHCRQPTIERWLITVEAFREVERLVGSLRLRDAFSSHEFKES
jgi:hypothetical protein